MSGFLRGYVTLVVVICVVAGLATALVAAGKILQPDPRRSNPADRGVGGPAANPTSSSASSRSPALVLALAAGAMAILVAPWAVAAGALPWGGVAAGLIAVAVVAVGVAASR